MAWAGLIGYEPVSEDRMDMERTYFSLSILKAFDDQKKKDARNLKGNRMETKVKTRQWRISSGVLGVIFLVMAACSGGGSGSSGANNGGGFNGVIISGGNTQFSTPMGIAVDGAGNIWIPNYGNNSVTELTKSSNYSNTGAVNISGGNTHFNQPTFIVVDGSENIWIPNHGNNSVTELTASSHYSNTGAVNISLGSLGSTNFSSPDGISVDGSGNIWVSNHHNNTVTELFKSSNYTTAQNFSNTTNGLNFNGPDGLCVDPSGNIWVPNDVGNTVTELNPTNSTEVNITTPPGSPGLSAPDACAVDQSGNIWTTNTSGNSVTEFIVSSGTVTGETTILGGNTGFNAPTEIAVDGAGNIWIANYNNNSIGASVTELTKSSGYAVGSAVNILESPPPGGPQGIAIDAAGNVWIANSLDNSLTELPGVATGVTTLPALAGAPPGS